MFEALLCTHLDALLQKADELETSASADEALLTWFREFVVFAQSYRGVVAMMAAARTNPDSALYASCAAVHSAGAQLLLRAQDEGTARTDMTGDDLFALITALGWALDQPSFASRADHLFNVIAIGQIGRAAMSRGNVLNQITHAYLLLSGKPRGLDKFRYG